MEFLLNRYRNLSVLLLAILAQLALLAYQVKSAQDVRLIRVWAVSAVTPVARLIEGGRGHISGFFHDYFYLLGVRQENKRMKADLERIEIENQYLRAQLSSADRASALAIFQSTSQSKTLAARVIGNTTDSSGKAVIVDRGASDGIQKGMAVIKPEGIVGKVVDIFPHAANVLLITDPSFAAGVVSQKNGVHGTLKGQGQSTVMVDYVQNEQTVDQGEWFLTSGDDLIFPRGLLVGQVTVVRPGDASKEIYVTPSGLQNGVEDVLIVLQGVHGTITEAPLPNQSVHLLAPPPEPDSEAAPSRQPVSRASGVATDLDRAIERYRAIGAAQNHKFGDKSSPAPNFNAPVEEKPKPVPAPNP
ncbi:MAG: rod shape-determining protein MreC [Bryobacterales bacterium]|nr:rod shape-determining protein MreC [Bryobacterales bacterium]MBV9401544.1 rod shape-determining protein MreC [Bryobacterales bacterium]